MKSNVDIDNHDASFFFSPKMNSSYKSLGTKSNWSEEELSDLVCGVTILSILLLMFCFFYVLCKIYSDDEVVASDEGMIALLQRRKRYYLKHGSK